ncbi:MAG: hypothetical protein AAGA67_06025 [Cyanobacteria bacterium P01_F01_bin.153]
MPIFWYFKPRLGTLCWEPLIRPFIPHSKQIFFNSYCYLLKPNNKNISRIEKSKIPQNPLPTGTLGVRSRSIADSLQNFFSNAK